VMKSLEANPPEGWSAIHISSHSEGGFFHKIRAYRSARKRMVSAMDYGRFDIAHFHVTHSMSWWRKDRLMKICERKGIPIVIHIHSGRFQEFCSGIMGNSVRRSLNRRNKKVVLLENRWLELLSPWIPSDSLVIPNSSESIANRSEHSLGPEIRLLVMSRNSRGKGHEFAIGVVESLQELGIEAVLRMTGIEKLPESKAPPESVEALGWVSMERRGELVLWADFLLQPSEFEGSSMSVIEAMASGLPPMVSVASKETVGLRSLVLPLESPRKWAERISQLSHEEEYLETVSSVRREAERFSPEATREQWGKLYESMLE